MGETVYRIEALRDKVVGLLRSRSGPMTAGAIAVRLELPVWAMQAGLDAVCGVGYLATEVFVPLVEAKHVAMKSIAMEGLL